MRKITPVRYWTFAILFCSIFLFSACKKDDKPDPAPVDSALENKLREVGGSIVRLDLSKAKVVITYSDDYNTGNTGPKAIIKPKDDLTIEILDKVLQSQDYRDFTVERTTPLITLTRRYYVQRYADGAIDGVRFESNPASKPGSLLFTRFYATPNDITNPDPEKPIWSAEITL